MAESGFIRVPRTTNLLVPLVHAAILHVPGVRSVINTPHFEFCHDDRVRQRITDQPPFYELVYDRYLIAAEASIFVEGARGIGRTLELKIAAVRIDGSDPGWGNLWHIDAWWRGVHYTEKPGKAAWSCWENKWDNLLNRKVKNQPNLPPLEISFGHPRSKRAA